MSTDKPLPADLAGYQQLAPLERINAGDLAVGCRGDRWWITAFGSTAGDYGHFHDCRVYREIPVAKQGDLDHKPEWPFPWTQSDECAARAHSLLPADASSRKAIPLATGLLDYFPKALCAVAECSVAGNKQHLPGQPLRWDRSRSSDEADALMRHLLERGKVDKDGVLHDVKCAWRALAMAEKAIEAAETKQANEKIYA